VSARERLLAALIADTCLCEGCEQEAAPLIDAFAAEQHAEGVREAADLIDNNDTCGCGSCGTCQARALAAELRDRADAIAPPTPEEPTP
jgi:hypothetical protein